MTQMALSIQSMDLFFQFKKYLFFLHFICHIYLFRELTNHGLFASPWHWVGEIL